jgi:hypothetical protein
MFEREENELAESKKNIKHLSIPDELSDQAIMKGIQQARAVKEKKRRRLPIKSMAAACILGISLITSVNVSEPVANYIANIPGMGKVIDFVRYDKGLKAAAENDYIQKVEGSAEHSGIKLTLDSIIHDEKALIMYYHFQTEDKEDYILPAEHQLKDGEGNVLPYRVYGQYWTEDASLLELRVSLKEGEKLPEDLMLSTKFGNDRELLDGDWEIPFTLDKEKFAHKQVHELDKKVEVGGQEITFKDVTIYPSQTAVHVSYNPSNSKKIFGFDDLQLVDEKGEIWNASKEETTEISENESIIYLESSYFSNPKELSLRFSSIRALDKDELWVEIDPEKEEILKAPKDGKISQMYKRKEELVVKLETAPNQFNSLIFKSGIDANGKDLGIDGFGYGNSPSGNYTKHSVPYPFKGAAKGPIKLKLVDYPSYIKAKVDIKVK